MLPLKQAIRTVAAGALAALSLVAFGQTVTISKDKDLVNDARPIKRIHFTMRQVLARDLGSLRTISFLSNPPSIFDRENLGQGALSQSINHWPNLGLNPGAPFANGSKSTSGKGGDRGGPNVFSPGTS